MIRTLHVFINCNSMVTLYFYSLDWIVGLEVNISNCLCAAALKQWQHINGLAPWASLGGFWSLNFPPTFTSQFFFNNIFTVKWHILIWLSCNPQKPKTCLRPWLAQLGWYHGLREKQAWILIHSYFWGNSMGVEVHGISFLGTWFQWA